MKFLILVLMFLAGTARSLVPEVYARKTTCAQLKAELQVSGTLVIVQKNIFGDVKKTKVTHSEVCRGNTFPAYWEFRTSDKKKCSVGQFCDWEPYNPADYDHGAYESTPSSSPSNSGYSESSSTPSFDPPSSDTAGPRYNPPSPTSSPGASPRASSGTNSGSSRSGSNYNPPSSGSRGSRYCPGC